MTPNRRQFIKGGVAAFTVSFAAPAFLSDIARAQGARARNLVVLYLSGGNDALSMVVPYGNAGYYQRRPTIAVQASRSRKGMRAIAALARPRPDHAGPGLAARPGQAVAARGGSSPS